MRGMKKVPSRPTSAQSNKGNKTILPSNINQKTGQSLQGLNVHGLGQG